MADSKLAQALAANPRNPVARFVGGLPPPTTAEPAPAQAPRARPQAQRPNPQQPIYDRLLARIKTGFGTPGPGALPGAALRPEVRQIFADQGGATAIDMTDITPEEQAALRMILDPAWVAQNGGR